MSIGKYFPFTYLIIIVFLFFYSFTQVDLGLTFAKFSNLHNIEMFFKEIGYFNRPLSTGLFIFLITILFLYFFYFLNLSIKNKFNKKLIWKLIIPTSIILSFSYVAFSHDLFNYIFDAKIVTFYNQNPYFHKALDFPNDPMLAFMHWTHRLYPYGPVWLGITIPVSFLGLNIFLINYFLFKILATVFYLGSVFIIYKINKKINPGSEIFNTVFFAFNPLVIIEILVSSHNDIAMIFFALSGLYLFFVNKKILGLLFVFISSQIKIPTIILLAPLIISLIPGKLFNFSAQKIALLSFISMIFIFFAALTKYEIQPWYLIWVIPFAAIIKPNKYIISLILGASLGLILRYSVFLYTGNWDGNLIIIRNSITLISIFVSLIIAFVWSRKKGYNLS